MHVVYSRQAPPPSLDASLFLAGPTPRSREVRSWRPRALEALRELGFGGVVFVPEDPEGAESLDRLDEATYAAQVAWEEEGLSRADAIVFWVPRAMETLPAMTTNVEWGKWCGSGKVVLGSPPEAEKMRYLRHDAARLGVPLADTLDGTLRAALGLLGEGAARRGGEAQIPLGVWRTPQLQSWLAAQRAAGHTLTRARVLWEHRTGPGRRFPFLWALAADLSIPAEERVKSGDVVIGRPDLSAVVAFVPADDPRDVQVLLVREVRPAAATGDGCVLELPGGSSTHGETDPRAVAAAELVEETGLEVDPTRLAPVRARQVAATLLSHRAHLFALELTPGELEELRAREGKPHGEPGSSERTYPELHRVGELLAHARVDWSNLGMILAALGRLRL